MCSEELLFCDLEGSDHDCFSNVDLLHGFSRIFNVKFILNSSCSCNVLNSFLRYLDLEGSRTNVKTELGTQ